MALSFSKAGGVVIVSIPHRKTSNDTWASFSFELSLFQFLIGRLVTGPVLIPVDVGGEFQFLIGRLVTRSRAKPE